MYKRVLLSTDLVPENQQLIDKATNLVKEWGAHLTIVHIVEPLPSYGYAYVGGADIETQLLDEAKDKIIALGKSLSVAEEDCIVDVGPTKVEILRIATEKKSDIIILGSHGRHGLGVLLGSTANAVVHRAKCDVLVVKLK